MPMSSLTYIFYYNMRGAMPDIPGMWQLAKLYRAIVAALNHFHHRSYFCVPKIFIVFSIYKCTWRSVGEFDFDIKSRVHPPKQK